MDISEERANSPTDLDDLFNYDVGLEDIFQGKDITSNNDTAKPAGDPSSLGLGLDEEVKITKKRQPVAKLDETRLLSQPGIPKLRRTAKQKLRLKGKGHEFSDAARLLNFYQLWLDDLFPRAKFSDGLMMIEKLGHTKRIQTMRREWIDEEKRAVFGISGTSQEATAGPNDPSKGPFSDHDHNTEGGSHAPVVPSAVSHPQTSTENDLFMPDSHGTTQPPTSHPEPDDDDLEDLLREQDEQSSGFPPSALPVLTKDHDEFDAEYEAMDDLGM